MCVLKKTTPQVPLVQTGNLTTYILYDFQSRFLSLLVEPMSLISTIFGIFWSFIALTCAEQDARRLHVRCESHCTVTSTCHSSLHATAPTAASNNYLSSYTGAISSSISYSWQTKPGIASSVYQNAAQSSTQRSTFATTPGAPISYGLPFSKSTAAFASTALYPSPSSVKASDSSNIGSAGGQSPAQTESSSLYNPDIRSLVVSSGAGPSQVSGSVGSKTKSSMGTQVFSTTSASRDSSDEFPKSISLGVD